MLEGLQTLCVPSHILKLKAATIEPIRGNSSLDRLERLRKPLMRERVTTLGVPNRSPATGEEGSNDSRRSDPSGRHLAEIQGGLGMTQHSVAATADGCRGRIG